MTFFQKILFPLDFSGAGTAMASPVVAMAQRLNARVTVLNAFHLAPDYIVAPRFADTYGAEPMVIPYTPVFEELRHAQDRRLKEFVRTQFIGVDAEARIEDGEAAMAIEWVAKHEHSDLIMMPTRGLGKFRRLLLGSVTAKVLHDVECPVFTSSHEADAKSSSPGGYQTILCAVRSASESEEALRIAVALAQAWRASVCILHIGPQSGAQETETAVESIRHGFLQSGNDAANSASIATFAFWAAPSPKAFDRLPSMRKRTSSSWAAGTSDRISRVSGRMPTPSFANLRARCSAFE